MIDMLISMALLSMVMTMVYGAFGQISTRAIDLTEELTEQQELRLLLRLIADDLGAARWLARYVEKGVEFKTGIIAETDFYQGRDFSDIHFHAARPSRFFRRMPKGLEPSLHEVGYAVRPIKAKDTLELVRREDFYLDDDMQNGGREVVVARDIHEFLVEFLPPSASDAAPNQVETWEKRWDSNDRPDRTRIPSAIRLTLARGLRKGRVLREVIEINMGVSVK